MAITKNIVDLAGGAISIQSEVDKGSCFTVEMPFLIDQDEKTTLPIRRVLLIAADQRLIDNAKAATRETGLTLLLAKSEAEADEAPQKGKSDIILLCSQLNGQRLADNIQRLREKTGRTPLFYCCDYEDQEQAGEVAEKCGVDAVLVRPSFCLTWRTPLTGCTVKRRQRSQRRVFLL